jgi:hypothetical protein
MEEEKYIILKCDCGEQYSVKRKNIEDDVEHLECNWCPLCMEKSKDPYNERKVYKSN